jgi:hypothetical protein
MRRRALWIAWTLLTLGIAGILWMQLTHGKEKSIFLSGKVTDGHHQIAEACDSCHATPYGGTASIDKTCVKCHGQGLEAAKDSHRVAIFQRPQNVGMIAKLDARSCVVCHTEHNPVIAQKGGATQPKDMCFLCHDDISKERPDHKKFAADSCADAGCHRYHDNTALYKDFLIKHADEPALKPAAVIPARDLATVYRAKHPQQKAPLTAANADAPAEAMQAADQVRQWERSSHAGVGVNCSGCHGGGARVGADPQAIAWHRKPTMEDCKDCHADNVKGFLAGKHGMTQAQFQSPMTLATARLPMQKEAKKDKPVTCMSCHKAHVFNTAKAAVESCLGCHADRHSVAYTGTPHHRLWQKEQQGQGVKGSGVSCATCHLPRTKGHYRGASFAHAEHNQNKNLRPNEKMIRSVCLGCHGLRFTIDALADPALMLNNYQGKPRRTVESVDMALEHQRQSRRGNEKTSGAAPR